MRAQRDWKLWPVRCSAIGARENGQPHPSIITRLTDSPTFTVTRSENIHLFLFARDLENNAMRLEDELTEIGVNELYVFETL